jgi:glycosyltransferase involved in cell wall biosynthesis
MTKIRVGILASTMSEKSGGAHTLTTNLRDALIRTAPEELRDAEIVLIGGSDTKSKKNLSPVLGIEHFEEIALPPNQRQRLQRFVWFVGKVFRLLVFRERFDPFLNRATSLNKLLQESGIKVLWSLEPMSFPVEIPYINTVWDIAHRTSPYFPEVSSGTEWTKREKNNSRAIQQAYLNVVGTEVGAQELCRAYGISMERILINPFPVLNFEINQVKSVRKSGMFFYPAQFWPHKNHVTLLVAMRILKDLITSPIQLILTGSDKGNLPHVQSLINSLGLNQEVKIEGFVSRQRITELYSQCGLFVFPSLIGPDNLPPLEAIAAGAPLLISRIPGHVEQIGDAAKYFDPLDPYELADAMKKSIESPEDWLLNQEFANGIRSTRGYGQYIGAVMGELNKLVKYRKVWP